VGSDERLFIYDRWTQLIQLLKPDLVTSVEELSEKLRVSKATVRRDLSELDAAGRLRRVRGGAVANSSDAILDSTARLMGQAGFDDSANANAQLKRAIGEKAAELLEPGDAVIIDGGSTTLELARNIGAMPLTILTTSIPILFALLGRPKLRVLITGGEVFQEQNIVLNPYGDGIVANFAPSKVFLGAQSLTRRGLMQTDPLLVQNEKELIAHADKIIVLADSSKFGAKGSLAVCGLDRISTVITDSGLSDQACNMLDSHDVEIIIAD